MLPFSDTGYSLYARVLFIVVLLLTLILGVAPSIAHADSGLNDGCQVGPFLKGIHVEEVGSLGRKIVITPTNATRFGGGPGSKYLTDELWGAVQDCVPDLYGSTADSVYQQLDCHLYFGADEKGTGPTWDLETYRVPLLHPNPVTYASSHCLNKQPTRLDNDEIYTG